MTKEELQSFGMEAGNYADANHEKHGGWIQAERYKFAELVAAHEREECAKVCDEAHELMNSSFQGAAAAIRARGN